MTADQLVGDASGDGGQVKVAVVAGDLGLEHDLEQQVAQFFGDRPGLPPLDGIDHLVGLFDHVGNQAGGGLGQIPRAAGFGVAQLGHDIDESLKGRQNSSAVAGKRQVRG